MWKDIYQLLSLIFTYNEKFARHDKQIEDLERKFTELTQKVDRLALAIERLAERDAVKEVIFSQKLENERLKFELRQLREQRTLPPKPTDSE